MWNKSYGFLILSAYHLFLAVDKNGYVYTLGHREQKDEWVPRRVDVFTRHNVLPPNAVVSAGSVNSACTAGGGQLYMWGKIKSNGDDWMYPKPLMDLRTYALKWLAPTLYGFRWYSPFCCC